MAPANISFRQKSRRRFILPAVLVVVAVGTALVFIGSDSTKKAAEEKTPQMAFTLTALQVHSEGPAVATATAQPERSVIVKMLTDYYQAAFVDPKKWSDPTWADLKAAFTADAQKSFDADVNSLTIGEGRNDFARVDPQAAQMKLSFYYDAAGKPALAVATVHFTARATTKSKRPVDVVQDATYRLEKTATGWQVFSYEAKATQDSPSPSPTASPTT